ncbi:hypothetical protein [Nocardia brasiliensis]|uniref:hypothetical protein n=1 Tax=Nocardia brasiliensis TaxID=37326 RepID=UPI0024543E33|nr:hypothetical protein [Nocardia brasiliensis]
MSTVSTLEEWAAYARNTPEPRATAVGDLAAQIRRVWQVDDDVPVVFYEEHWDRWDQLWCTCCEGEGTDWVIECGNKKATFDSDYNEETWQHYRAWLTNLTYLVPVSDLLRRVE